MWGRLNYFGNGGISPHGGTSDFMGGLQNPLETMIVGNYFIPVT